MMSVTGCMDAGCALVSAVGGAGGEVMDACIPLDDPQYPPHEPVPWKRREKIGLATLYLADARDVLPTLEPESVTLLWTDPPYGHANHDGDFNARLNLHRGLESHPIANDTADGMREVVDAVLTAAVPALRADCCCCCCCCGGGPRPTFAWVADRMDRKGLSFFHSVIWDKLNPGLGWRFRRRHEMVMVAHRTGGKLAWVADSRAVPNIWEGMPPRNRQHPNEKPEGLPAHFIELTTERDDVVLDPFMGGGSTGVAAVRAGRRFVGVELAEQWFEVACRRIEEAQKQGDMFRDALS